MEEVKNQFDNAFDYAKAQFLNNFDKTIQTRAGIKLLADLFCISHLLQMHTDKPNNHYKIDFKTLNKKPWEVKYASTQSGQSQLHTAAYDRYLNVVQRARPFTQADILSQKLQFIQTVVNYKGQTSTPKPKHALTL